ncbi:hypothetical protein H206_06238 [Candidatus Electrothrix aarhusensis]|uniref:Uncharacterized protein n=1 Tax=Candidatus Electrothrix aarhusensis TaxID=1859131 RepID=A0A444J334_9BACT|nr:hypothetical protein H206_06238 [Candidatus Electrothrix aarhusensis]
MFFQGLIWELSCCRSCARFRRSSLRSAEPKGACTVFTGALFF